MRLIKIFMFFVLFFGVGLSVGEPGEWDGSGLDVNVVASVQHALCSYNQSIPMSARAASSVQYVVISRLHCAQLCMNHVNVGSACLYFMYMRNRALVRAEAVAYPAYNFCYIFTSELASPFMDSDINADSCRMSSTTVKCTVTPCHLMSGQHGCPTKQGPYCTCPVGKDPAFCYDDQFHTWK